jgi:hypothetical protein
MAGAERRRASTVIAEWCVPRLFNNVVFHRFFLPADEPEEVAVVKTALIQHLEFDSKVTLGVLCDQIVPPDDPMEDEDRTIRERLRALVVAFLAEDARQPLLSQLQRQGRRAADQEDSLIDTLIKVRSTRSPNPWTLTHSQAISKSGAADTTKIIADILVFLPSFNDSRPTRHGNSLVSMLLARAGSALREDLAPGRNPANLDQSRVYLELSDLLCRAKSAAEPVQLLRFYCTSSLMGKMTLGRLSRESRAFFIASLAGALAACSSQKSPESSELASMRRQVVDALSVILPVRPPALLHCAAYLCARSLSSKSPRRTRKRGGRAKFYYKHASRLVDRDLAGRLTNVIFLSFYLFSRPAEGTASQLGRSNASPHASD